MSSNTHSGFKVADLIVMTPGVKELLASGIREGRWSQTEVAQQTGVHKSTIGRWVKEGQHAKKHEKHV